MSILNLLTPLIEAMLASAATSFVLALVCLAVFRGETGRRYAGAVGFTAGYIAAFAWMEPRHLTPSMYWHWLPWLTAGGAIAGPIGIATGVRTPERWALSIVLALVAAWFLVPTRTALQPWRLTYVLVFVGCLTLLWNLLDPLIQRGSGGPIFFALATTTLGCSALVAHVASLRIGSLGAIGAAALAGGGVAVAWTRDRTSLRGLLPCQSVVLCGVIMTAHLGDGFPKYAPILILIAPLMLWLFEFGPLAKLRGMSAMIAKASAVCLPLGAAWFA